MSRNKELDEFFDHVHKEVKLRIDQGDVHSGTIERIYLAGIFQVLVEVARRLPEPKDEKVYE